MCVTMKGHQLRFRKYIACATSMAMFLAACARPPGPSGSRTPAGSEPQAEATSAQASATAAVAPDGVVPSSAPASNPVPVTDPVTAQGPDATPVADPSPAPASNPDPVTAQAPDAAPVPDPSPAAPSNPVANPVPAQGPDAVPAAVPQTDEALLADALADLEKNGEIIVVSGMSRSMQKAHAAKRDADQIVDTVVAEDIGKLPDVTVSETAARIPGVQVDRARGEAAGQVLVRGLPDVTTTYNGREIFTAETRSVALGDFPAGGIASLDVYKTTTADLVEGGLAGLIDVRSRRPFDFDGSEGLKVAGSVRGSYANQSGRFDPNGNLLVSDRWKTGVGELGALLNVSYTRLNYLDSVRFDSGFIATGRDEATGEDIRFPDTVGIFYGGGERVRGSANWALQWKPKPGLELYVEGVYQGYRDQVSDRQLEMRLFGDPATRRLTNVTLRPGTNQAQSLTVEGAARPFMFQGATDRKTDTYQIAVGGSYELSPFRLSADVARTKSRFDMSLYSLDSELASAPRFDVNFDVPKGPGGMEFAIPGYDLRDPANYHYLAFFDRAFVAAGDDWQFRTDVVMDTHFAFIPKLEAGLRYTTRNASQRNGQRYCANDDDADPSGPCVQLASGTPLSELPVTIEEFRGGFRGAGISSPRTWLSATYDSIRNHVEQLRALQGFNPGAPTMTRIFGADENALAGYAQARYEFKVGDIAVDGFGGLRAVKTNTTVVSTDEGTSSSTDLLPSASTRVRFPGNLQLRLGANKTRTRPAFSQLAPTILNSPPPCLSDPAPPPECRITGGGGNPELEPVVSNNYDLSVEYFFGKTGMASLAAFDHEINGFITNLEVKRDDPVYGPDRVILNIPVNAGDGSIRGFEASLGGFLEPLPGWLSRFGASANVTYLRSEQAFPEGIQLEDGNVGRIPGVSTWSYNLIAMYEKPAWYSTRLAYNARSRWITSYVQDPDAKGFSGEFVSGTSRLDWSASYTPWKNLTFTVDWTNILRSPFRSFRQFTGAGDNYPRDVRYEESIFMLGARAEL